MPLARPRCFFGTMVVMAAMYAGHWNAPLRPYSTAAAPYCQSARRPVALSTRIAVVATTAPRSLTIIMSLRLYRSTMAPAMGEMRMNGTAKHADTRPRVVARPVSW